jgi:dTDP-4-amino-4,6-dideoxygalactose transaminase
MIGLNKMMTVPLLDLKPQLEGIESEIKDAINEVIDTGRFIMGPNVEQLESEIAKYVDAEFGIGVTSGTDALLLSLMALGVKAGDIVITTPFSFFATAGAVARLGATPVFVDIDPQTYNISPDALRHWFDNEQEKRDKVRAIIPVHLYGQSADMGPILDIAEQYNAAVVEDAAQAIGTRYSIDGKRKKVGGIGTMGCFSFFPSKNLGAMGDGGMIVTNDSELAAKLKMLRNHGASPKYYHSIIGGNFRLDAMQAAVLLVKLKRLEKWHEMRRKNAACYDEKLSIDKVAKPLNKWGDGCHIYNQYVISVSEKRDQLRAFLAENGISSEIYYPVPFHLQKCFEYLGYKEGDFPNSEYAANHVLALPVYPGLTVEAQDYVVEKIGEFFA